MKVFFETIEKIYYILAGKHSGRMQKYKKITDKEGNTKKVIEKFLNTKRAGKFKLCLLTSFKNTYTIKYINDLFYKIGPRNDFFGFGS